MFRSFLVIGVLACGVLSSSTAEAVAPAKFRLALDSTLFRFTTGHRAYDSPNPRRDFQHAEGGLGLPSWGLIFGGAVTPSIVLGVRAHAAASGDADFGNDIAFKYGGDFLFEYIFLRNIVRPFFMFQAGIEGYLNSPDNDRDPNDWWLGFGGDAGGGLHLVASRRLSFDFTALAGARGGPGGERNGNSFTHFRFSTAVLFGISGWLG